MSRSGQSIESLLRRISQQQSSPPGELFSVQDPISGGLGRIGSISQINNSQSNQRGFSELVASLRMLRDMPGLNMDQLQDQLQRQGEWPDPETIPMPPHDSRLDVEPTDDEDDEQDDG